jgi:hypothetical protein
VLRCLPPPLEGRTEAPREPLREGQHDDLLFAPCLGGWAWENAIEKLDYISYPGEWELEGVPMNVVGKAR